MEPTAVNEKDFIINFPLLSTRKHKIGFVCSGVLDDITGLHTHCFDGKVDNLHKINFVSKREVKQLKLVNFLFGTSVKTIESDYKYRMITVDNSGYVRVHEPGRAKPNLLGECAGNSKKVLRFNKDRTKLFFISASDRSTVIEVDLKSIDLKKRERRFFHGKIIDIQVVKNTLVGLSKDGFVEFLDLSLPDYVPPKKKKKDDKQPAEEEPEPIIVKLSNSDIDEYTCLGYDSANQHFLAVGYRYYPPEDKSQPPAGGNKGTTTSAQIGFTNNVIISFTVADLCIVSTDIKIEGDKFSHLFKLVEGVQTARGLFYFAIGGGDSRAVYCINSRTLENTEILLKTSNSCNDIAIGNEFINVTTNDGYLFRINMFKVRSDADDIIDGDSDDDDDNNILDPNLADDDDPQPKNSGDYEDGGK